MGNSEPDTQDQVGHQRDTVQVDAPSDHDPEEGEIAQIHMQNPLSGQMFVEAELPNAGGGGLATREGHKHWKST